MPKRRDHSDLPVEDLLEALGVPGNAAAWHAFLEQFASDLIRIARQYANDEGEANDCFLYTCEQLCAHRCRRLQQFKAEHGATFRTWLIAVVNNICIDWHRSVYGRPTTPTAIRNLSDLEQRVYRLRFEQNLDIETCLLAMRRDYPDLSRGHMSQALASVHAALSSKQRWGILARSQRGHLSLDENLAGGSAESTADGPRHLAETEQQTEALRSALSRLTPRQRLVLRLRFEQELTLSEVARVAGLTDLHQARRLINTALEDLQAHLAAAGFFN